MRTFRSLFFVAWCFLTFVPLCAMQISLEQALKSGTAQDVQQALQSGRLDARGKSRIGYHWIVWAAMFNPNPEVISLLLKAGADVNVLGGINNSTPLGVAAWNNTPEVVSVLLKAGARVNATNQFGSTPLMVAAGHNPKAREVIALLLDAGADVNAKDLSGRTAVDYARHDASLPEKYISSTADPAIVQQLLAAARAQPTTPEAATAASLTLDGLSFDDIYPVFHNYYDTHPLGTVVLRNTSGAPITGIKVSFQIKEFMYDPKDCPAPAELAPGESKSVDLFGLFLPAILETTRKPRRRREWTLSTRSTGRFSIRTWCRASHPEQECHQLGGRQESGSLRDHQGSRCAQRSPKM